MSGALLNTEFGLCTLLVLMFTLLGLGCCLLVFNFVEFLRFGFCCCLVGCSIVVVCWLVMFGLTVVVLTVELLVWDCGIGFDYFVCGCYLCCLCVCWFAWVVIVSVVWSSHSLCTLLFWLWICIWLCYLPACLCWMLYVVDLFCLCCLCVT